MKPIQINRIVVPLDFSEISLTALDMAATIAKRQDAKLILMHVVEPIYFNLREFSAVTPMNVLVEMKKEAKRELKKNADIIAKKYGVEIIRSIVVMGQIVEEITQTVVNEYADMIIMGTHGASGFREFFIGSNAYSVVKHSPCPVLTFPKSQQIDEGFKKILFPIRLVAKPLDKYEYIRDMVKKDGSHLHILGLISTNETSANTKLMKKHLNELLRNLQDDKIAFTPMIKAADDLAKETLKNAEEINADLIVTTANLDHSFREFFIGPYVQRIVNHSKYPVLSIRPSLSAISMKNIKKIKVKRKESYAPVVGLAT